MKVRYFSTSAALRRWLERNHATVRELWVGYYKVGTGRPSVTWPESVDEALCFGWIDGIRKSIDERRYSIRLTPRRPGSNWSTVNIGRALALKRRGLLQPPGLAAFRARKGDRTGVYSYENRSATLVEPYATRLRRNRGAWTFLRAQSPSYQKAVNWWVVSARHEATRLRRLEQLVEHSANGRLIPQFLSRKRSP